MSEFVKKVEKSIRILYTLFSILRCWPSKAGEIKLFNLFLVLSLVSYLNFVTCYSIYSFWPDYEQVSIMVTPYIGSFLLVMKFINFIVYRKKFSKQLKIVKEEFWYGNKDSPQEEKDIIEYHTRFVFICNTIQASIICSASPLWLILPYLQMYVFAPKNPDQPFERILPFRTWLPFGLDQYSDPWYAIVYVIDGIVLLSGMLVLASMDCIYVHLTMNVCAQFKILQKRIINFNKDSSGELCDSNVQEQNLFDCIELHQNLMNICIDLEEILTTVLFLQFFTGSMFLCSTGFSILLFPGNTFILVQNVMCICSSLAQLFLHSYTADRITSESLKVGQAAYKSEWYDSPQKIKKIIYFIIMRSQNPIYLTAGKFAPVNIKTFETVTRTAMSYFTLLTSVRDK